MAHQSDRTLDLSDLIQRDSSTGQYSLAGERMVMLRLHAFSTLCELLLDQLGPELSRELFFRFGYACGRGDFELVSRLGWRAPFGGDGPIVPSDGAQPGLLSQIHAALGPLLETWEGLARVALDQGTYDQEANTLHLAGRWLSSFEVEIHRDQDLAHGPACFTLAGYKSGWCTALLGRSALCVERSCVATGDEHCCWELRPLEEWDHEEEAAPFKRALEGSHDSRYDELARKRALLERTNEELSAYSQALEKRVRDRTADLHVKNKELHATLAQLQHVQMQAVMQEKMAGLGNLVAGIAHEINTPVGAFASATEVSGRCVRSLLEALERCQTLEAFKEDRKVEKALSLLSSSADLALEASGRVTQMVRNLKNFARRDEPDWTTANVHDGLESTLVIVSCVLKNKTDVIKRYGDLPEITCHPNQLNQVFMNLLVNAGQAIEGSGTITISTELRPVEGGVDRVVIRIADNGKGMTDEVRERLFEPGFTTKGAGVGTGLGLSISKSIIDKHNGQITVESSPGEGATFTITLPVVQPNQPA